MESFHYKLSPLSGEMPQAEGCSGDVVVLFVIPLP
jgi:hypothetical protein